jgi:hypothetical protein
LAITATAVSSPELLCSRNELERDRADLAPQMLGDDQDAHASFSCTISWMRLRDLGRATVQHFRAPRPSGHEHLADMGGRLAEIADRPNVDLLLLACLIARSVA